MKKLFIILFLLSGFCISSFARHIAGGEIFYEYMGPGTTTGTSIYKITLRLFRDCLSGGAQLDGAVNIAIYDKAGNTPILSSPFTVNLDHTDVIQKGGNIPCIINAPVVCYQVGYYYLTVTLADNPSGYWVSFQRCCRIDNISNLSLAIGAGATYLGSIAGTNVLGSNHNSSPQFFLRDTALVCQNRKFTLDFGASDPDGDSLTYEFCEAYDGGNSGNPVITNPPPPPYTVVPYGNGYFASSPLGAGVTINPTSGIISGMAPAAGTYVIAVCVYEWRNGSIINTHRKDFILQIGDCDFVAAQLPLTGTFCDDFVTSFENLTPSALIFSWHWDFGVNGISSDTSNLAIPTFTYPDTGIYVVKLIVNKDDPCTDSATMKLGVYPGFFPDFISTGVCVSKLSSFVDKSTTVYGTVNSWKWDFGESAAINDTSRSRNPSYTYPAVGVKSVQLITTSTKGCIDTINKDVTIINKPIINFAFKDTLICKGDSLSIPATGIGVFSWTPNSNILFASTPTPLVFPPTTSWYSAQLDDNGCVNKDSVRIRVIDNVTLTVRTDTSFCKGDGVQLTALSNALYFSWTPNIALSDPNIINPIANPAANTTYQLKASVGSCSTIDDITVFVVPYPTANAGLDETICYKTQVQLNGSVIASSFYWKPQSVISNPFILNPIASPVSTTRYVLVANDTLGCPKSGYDTVLVTVLPKVKAFAGSDTSIVAGQPLQLNASGGENYSWSPAYGLSNASIGNPVVRLNGDPDSIRYKVYVTDLKGCLDSASMLVKVFKTEPQIFVPTGFTPNGDGRNDVLKPIAVGIEKIEYFRVYNRWGQLVFSTTQNGKGWDGKIAGSEQPTATFVWLVKGVDYTGKSVFEKGTTTLIR
jgi:gliding motility-associated-like protein